MKINLTERWVMELRTHAYKIEFKWHDVTFQSSITILESDSILDVEEKLRRMADLIKKVHQ